LLKFNANLGFFLLLIGVAVSLTVVGELSGEFGQIRKLSSKSQNVLNITKGEFVTLNNNVLFGFNVDSKGNDILQVKLDNNHTYSWQEPIENGKRIFRRENFTLDTTVYSFEIDVSVKFYDKQTLQIIDNTNSTG
jgi:hypothetical protein